MQGLQSRVMEEQVIDWIAERATHTDQAIGFRKPSASNQHQQPARDHGSPDQSRIRLKVYNPDKPVTLSDVLPIMEKMGFRVIAELPFEIEPNDTTQKIWIHDFLMERQSHADMPDVSN